MNVFLLSLFFSLLVFSRGQPQKTMSVEKGEASPDLDSSYSDGGTQNPEPTKSQKSSSSSRYKGVVPQQNGHWGAQIYANHQRIWLGTFKTEEAAASAYNSAALKLRPANPANKPLDPEAQFQAQCTVDQVLNMIKNGSYQAKFAEFLSSNNGSQKTTSQVDDPLEEGYSYQELFRKELTPSDVGKLNRLVIPKRYALEYFPKIDENANTGDDEEEDEERGDIEITIHDKSLKKWSFRYCYWKSSQSFVFTRGWNKFVKEKDLKAGDTVAFYMCEWRQNGTTIGEKEDKKFLMIDILRPSRKGLRLFGVQIC